MLSHRHRHQYHSMFAKQISTVFELGDQQHLVWMGGTSSLGGVEAEDTWEDDLRCELEGPLERQRRIAELLSRFDGDGPGSEEVLEVLGLDRGLDRGRRTFILTAELQPATQRLIDRLGCRHPATLQRVSQVYASVARREGDSAASSLTTLLCLSVLQLHKDVRERNFRQA